MDFDTVRLLGNSSRSILLPLYPQPSSIGDPYFCKGIVGLDPPPIDVHLSETPQFPGMLLSRHSQSREIVTRVGLNPYFTRVDGGPQTFGDLRDHMYRTVLAPNSKGEVTFQLLKSVDLATPLAQIKGYVRQFEAAMFSKDPETQISMICPNAPLESPSTTNLVNAGTAAAPVFENLGNASVGFLWNITLTSTLSSLTFLKVATGQSMVITAPLSSGSILSIDTRPGTRGVFLITGGTPTNLMGALSSFSEWLMLDPGVNSFTMSSSAYTHTSGNYTQSWWGV
jgi:Phage tail protein